MTLLRKTDAHQLLFYGLIVVAIFNKPSRNVWDKEDMKDTQKIRFVDVVKLLKSNVNIKIPQFKCLNFGI